MAYSPIEESYMNGFVTTQFSTPEPEPVLLAENTGARPTQQPMTDTGGGAAVGTRLKMPSGLNTPENIQKVGGEIIPAGAAIAKGAGQASVGMYGDIEGLGRMVLNYMGVDVNEKTKLPTTEEVKGFLDKYIPIDKKYATFESAGELASPAGAYGLGKAAIKTVKSTKGMPIGNSIKMMDGTEITLPKAPKVESKAFKNWFGESKAVDDAGTPIVVYHGTASWSDEIKNDKYRTGKFFTSSPKVAERFGKTLVPAYIKTDNPYIVDAKGSFYASIDTPKEMKKWATTSEVDTDLIAEYALKHGYDSAIIRNVLEGNGSPEVADDFIVFSPEQIKSAIGNKGTFDPSNPSILHGAGAGAVATQQEENK